VNSAELFYSTLFVIHLLGRKDTTFEEESQEK